MLLPIQARAALVVNSFIPDLTFTQSCQLQLEYSLSVVPNSVTTGNSYFVTIVPVVNGVLQSAQGQDTGINIPANGILVNQTLTLSGFVGGDYQVKIIENTSNQSFVGQYGVNDLSLPSCTSSNTNNPSSGNTQDPSVTTSQSPDMEIPIDNPISVGTIPDLIQKVLEGIIKIGIPLLVVMIVYAGALYIFAAGNVAKLKSAHDAFLYTLLGGAILLGAWALAQLIQSTLIDLTAYTSSFFL